MKMLLGVHVSAEGKIFEAVKRAHSLGCNTMQVFSRSPQRWRRKALSPEDIREFLRSREKFKIDLVFIHIPYLINLASPDPQLYKASVLSFIEDIREADSLKADYIVTHMGSHKDTSEGQGLKRLIAALNRILAETRGVKTGILLENTAGSGSWLGYKFNHQELVFQEVMERQRLGLCLDTAHAYLAGYDIAQKEGLREMLEEIDSHVGLNFIKLIHLNDAWGKLGSRYDRHAHIGKGSIGLGGLKRIINHPQLRNTPFILETPKDTPLSDRRNLKIVRILKGRNSREG